MRQWVDSGKAPADCAAVFVAAANESTLAELVQFSSDALTAQLSEWIQADEHGRSWCAAFIAESLQLVEIEPEQE